VLETYALILHEHHRGELAALLHQGAHVARAHQHLSDFIRDLLTQGTASGDVRDDVAPEELASYCLHAITAATSLPSKAAVRRLVSGILAGLQPPRQLPAIPLEPAALCNRTTAGGWRRRNHGRWRG
jgi:hypothetical protein